jgi:hypothetical protein
MNVKNAPNPTLIKPIKVIIILRFGGVIADNPIRIPTMPVAKNIIIRTLTRVGSMYLITNIKKSML